MILLRPYQKNDLANIRGKYAGGARRVLYCAPTGSGKTIVFVHLARRISENGKRVFIITHRQELVDQPCVALSDEGVEYGVIAAGHPERPGAPVQVAMVQTLINLLDRLNGVNFIIVDEAHHALATMWLAIIRAAPNARLLGASATPERLDGGGLSDVFDALAIGPSVKELIAAGYLSPFIVYAPERLVNLKGAHTIAGDFALNDLARRMNAETVMNDMLAEYRQRLDGRTALAFCANIAHSQAVARFLRANGIRARHLDGDTPAAERRRLIAALANGYIEILTNCGLISEGLDVPSVGGVILLRPTKSLAIHLQQIGRALRSAPGKQRAIILDHAGNCLRHGLPDLEHQWNLEGRPKKKGEALVRRCPECGALIAIAERTCPECGADLRPEPVRPTTTPEPLVELDSATAHERWLANGMFQAVMQWAGDDIVRLYEVAKARGYKPGWVYWRLKKQQEAADRAVLEAAWGE